MAGGRTRSRSTKGLFRPTRRQFIEGAAVAGSAANWPLILIPGKAKASERLVVVNYGGPLGEAKKKAYYDPFTKETGIPITVVSGPEFAKVRAQVEAKDIEWDVVDLLDSLLPAGEKLGLFERIDETVVKRDGVIPDARREYAVGNYVYAGGIGYPTDRLGATGKHPENWAEFFDAKAIPGRRGLRNRIQENLELALMSDGVPASKVYPCDVERGFKALDRLKPHITNWIDQPATTVSLIQLNECDFTYTYSNNVLSGKQANIPVGFSFKQNVLAIGFTTITKGTRNKDAAMRLCELIMRPDRQIELAKYTGMAPAYPDARAKVDPSVRDWLPDINNPDNLFDNVDWWSGKVEELTRRFKEWQLT